MLSNLGSLRAGAILARARDVLIDAVYPPRCLTCHESTEAPHGLCPACWRDTHFIAGAACWTCGTQLVGEAEEGDRCQSCLDHPPAWNRGRAAVVYSGAGRRAILALKHGDRLDMARPLAGWLAVAGGRLVAEADVVAPVPLHWRRLIRRRYNQSAELGRHLARRSGVAFVPDLLTRRRMTTPQERMDRGERHANQAGAIAVTPGRVGVVSGRAVLLVDDVLTSGATLSACAEACRVAGATRIDVLVLARVVFDGRAA